MPIPAPQVAEQHLPTTAPDSATCWQRVEAHVRLSLSPLEMYGGNPRMAAARRAFSSLLMRYNEALGGVVVAQLGGLDFKSQALAISNPSSPFAHVLASATVLVFSPPRGAELVGVVDHLGPDHLGIALLSSFHVVLPLRETAGSFKHIAPDQCWVPSDGNGADRDDAIFKVGSRVRFAVQRIERTREGIFHIVGTLCDLEGCRVERLGSLGTPLVVDPPLARADQNAASTGGERADEHSAHDEGKGLAPSATPKDQMRRSLNVLDDSFDDPLGISVPAVPNRSPPSKTSSGKKKRHSRTSSDKHKHKHKHKDRTKKAKKG